MGSILLPILPGTLPPEYCFTSWQKLLVDLSNSQNAVLDGSAFFNYGPNEPDPQYQGYPWLKSTDMRWYFYSGNWLSPVNYDLNERRIYVGSLTDLVQYDGGDSGVASDRSGPMWERDTNFNDRIPMGIDTIVTSPDPAAAGSTAGSATHILTEAEGAVGQHSHPMGVCDPSSDDGYFPITGTNTVPGWNGHFITGNGPQVPSVETTANLYTLASGTSGGGVTPTAFSIIPPVRGVYVIKWTGRLYRKGA